MRGIHWQRWLFPVQEYTLSSVAVPGKPLDFLQEFRIPGFAQ